MHINRGESLTVKNELLMFISSFLLAINLLLYAFFQFDINKNLIRVVCVLLCAIIFFQQKRCTGFEFVLFGIATYLIVTNGAVSINMAFMLVLAVSMRVLNKDRLICNYNRVHLLLLVVVLLSLRLGLVQNTLWSMSGRSRYNFGFSHVNYVGLLTFSAVSILLLNRKYYRWYIVLGCLCVSYYLYNASNSRTGFIGVVLFVALSLLFRILPAKHIKRISVGFALLLFLSVLLWGSPLLNNSLMNTILSRRPELFARYIYKNSIVNLILGGSKVGEVDNSFLLILYNCGLPLYVAFTFATIHTIRSLVCENETDEVAFVLSTLTIATMESSLLRPEIPCMTLFWVIIVAELSKSLRVTKRYNREYLEKRVFFSIRKK